MVAPWRQSVFRQFGRTRNVSPFDLSDIDPLWSGVCRDKFMGEFGRFLPEDIAGGDGFAGDPGSAVRNGRQSLDECVASCRDAPCDVL